MPPDILAPAKFASRPQITSLAASLIPSAVYAWLCATSSANLLSRLSMHVETQPDCEAGGRLVGVKMGEQAEIGGILKELRLSLETKEVTGEFHALSGFSRGGSLSGCASLQTLILSFALFEDVGIHISTLLSQLPSSNSLIRLGLNYRLHHKSAAAHFQQLKRVVEVLTQDRFRKLLEINLHIRIYFPELNHTDVNVDAEVKESLVGLKQRGVQVNVHCTIIDSEPEVHSTLKIVVPSDERRCEARSRGVMLRRRENCEEDRNCEEDLGRAQDVVVTREELEIDEQRWNSAQGLSQLMNKKNARWRVTVRGDVCAL
ncbi:hypothetical protein BKA93DRAFT_750552 [Sparassis latifolia]